MDLDDLCCGSISQIAPLIEDKSVLPVELTSAMLERIERIDPDLHAYVHVDRVETLRAAKAAQDQVLSGGYLGPLHGVPLGIKDIFDTVTQGHSVLITWFPERAADRS